MNLQRPRKQCYTCVSNPKSHKRQVQKQFQLFETTQILLNSSKILKGSKRKNRKHLRTQLLKGMNPTICPQNKSYIQKLMTKSTMQTIDNTPRAQIEARATEFDMDEYEAEKQLFYYIQEKRKISSRQSKQRLKLFNQPINKHNINRIIFSKKQADYYRSKSPFKTVLQNPELTFRETLFSKQLKRSSDKSKSTEMKMQLNQKGMKIAHTIQNRQINCEDKFQSVNLDKRMNEYMNVLLQKTQKDDIDLMVHLSKNQKEIQKQSHENFKHFFVHNKMHSSFQDKCKSFSRSIKNSRSVIQKRKQQRPELKLQNTQIEIQTLKKINKSNGIQTIRSKFLKNTSYSGLLK